ncbi:MAG: response regulator [Verrucomicrobia bacterium]|nr:response regulator [Verrucomicrobiota bacterium]NBU10553.1 response regulator [Pseudomonadota bacterium]NDA66270.1 response regulator [Verrucomicrobiota bacterium]NDB75206.1 response regulator [Verrucomicrobiota bacterium]NDD38323.1 response regulator [Verrucomicrobiota bacterium]
MPTDALPNSFLAGPIQSVGSAHAARRLLLVEDHEPALVAVCDYLISKGFQVEVARNGAEAVGACERSLPEMILMDVQMPQMDGLEATKKIRDLPGGKSIKILAFTALAMRDDQERCLAAGADAYMSKPFRFSELLSVINRFIPPHDQSLPEK